MIATNALRTQIIGSDVDVAPKTVDAEACRWVLSFTSIRLDGLELGHRELRIGIPARIRTRSYQHRSDDLSDGAPFMKVSRLLAGDAVAHLVREFGQMGLVEIEAWRGRDGKEAVDEIVSFVNTVLPDPILDDDPEDLFARRHAQLVGHRATMSGIWLDALESFIESNNRSRQYVRAYCDQLIDEAMKKRTQVGAGRFRPSESELRMLAWCGLKPSRHFDGFEEPNEPPKLSLPQELVHALVGSTSKDEELKALKLRLAEQEELVARLIANTERLQGMTEKRK